MQLTTASLWHDTLAEPVLRTAMPGTSRSTLARFRDIAPEIEQPELGEHLVSLHLGGPKRMRRWHCGRFSVHDIANRSLTVMPAHEANRWLTEGPVEFAHLSISPGVLAQFVVEELDREPRGIMLRASVGQPDPFLAHIYLALIEEAADPFGGVLYKEALMTAFLVAILRKHSTIAATHCDAAKTAVTCGSRGGLAGWQLRRVIDYLHAHLGEAIEASALIALTGLSRAQFLHAFRQSTGTSPHAYFNRLRVERAQALLATGCAPNEVGVLVGHPNPLHFARWFRRVAHMTPVHSIRSSESGGVVRVR